MTTKRSIFLPRSAELSAVLRAEPLLNLPVDWLLREDVSVERLLGTALAGLTRRGHRLPAKHRTTYLVSVVLGQFLARWHRKHRRRSLHSLEAGADKKRELDPLLCAIAAVGNERTFRRVTPRLARRSTLHDLNVSWGSADEFAAFVVENDRLLASRFLRNFDSSKPLPARKAVPYLQIAAVSIYLDRRTRPIRSDVPNLQGYLEHSPRLSERTRLAVKLAYLPSLLSNKERDILRTKHGWTGPFRRRIPIKSIAKQLGYASPGALYRKLYRVRAWCRTSDASRAEKAEGAVRF